MEQARMHRKLLQFHYTLEFLVEAARPLNSESMKVNSRADAGLRAVNWPG